MAVSTATSHWKHVVIGAASVFALACGGDDDGGDNGAGNNPPPATGVVLGKDIVGKACTAAADCGSGGRCAPTQSFGMLSAFLETFGLATALPAPGGYCTVACANDANCGEGGICLGALGTILMGECRKSCTANSDCRPGYECAKPTATGDGGRAGAGLAALPAQCQALPAADNLAPNQSGAACSDQPDAGALSTACGDGYCALGSCTGTCSSDSTCGAGGACVPNGFYGSSGSCQETCAVDTDCNRYSPTSNYGCVDYQGRKLCGAKLQPLPANTLGIACTEDSQCGNGTCLENLGGVLTPLAAPNGYCSLQGCSDDTVCTGGACIGNAGAGRCLDTCTVDNECRSGYSCVERVSATMVNTKVCLPTVAQPDAGTRSAVVPVGLDGGI
jgi:hypothetical protein